MSCEVAQERFSEYYDGGLSSGERRALEHHLGACPTCKMEFGHFTTSLKALHDTTPLETTRVFVTNVKAAAAADVERRELYRQTGIEAPKAPPRAPATPWIPYALAAVTLLALGIGYLVGGSGRDQDREEIRRTIEREFASRRPEIVTVKEPVNEADVLKARNLVEVDGRWIPREMKEAFDRGDVYVRGLRMERRAAAELLSKEFPPVKPDPPSPAPAPTVEEILGRAGYEKTEKGWVPREWRQKWTEGFVQTGVDEWRRPEDFKEEFAREHNLVEHRGRLMTREQKEELEAQQRVVRPDTAPASNDVTRALEGLEIAPPMNYGGLTLYPLVAPGPAAAAPLLSLHAALATGRLEVAEAKSLFAVQVRNPLETDLLLLCGEVLSGGKCARVVAEDTLVPRGGAAAVPVLCVEPGAWRSAEKFAKESGHYVVPPALRRALVGESGQGAAWGYLATRLERGMAGQVELFRKRLGEIADYRASFARLPELEPGAVGLAVAFGDRIHHAEVFGDHALFAAYFERIAAGAALEALERAGGGRPLAMPAYPNSIRGVKQFLEGAFFCGFDPRPNGLSVRRDEACVGRACAAGDGLRHVLLFAGAASEPERRAPAGVPDEKLKKALDEIEGRMKNAGASHRVAAARELGSLAATAALLRHVKETDPDVRRAVVRELGAVGDPRAFDPLHQLVVQSRSDPAFYEEAIQALARLGDVRGPDAVLKQADLAAPDVARLAVLALPEAILRVRVRGVIERAMVKLIALHEAAEAATRGENVVGVPPNLRPADALRVVEAILAAQVQVTGRNFESATSYRKWWNDRSNREKFLKERLGE
jgi:hypothetical protein